MSRVDDMTEATDSRVQRYILEGSDAELRRLLSVSEVTAGSARRAFSRAGISEGWTAIDCGCGPIGALAVLAEMVGPAGRVVGVDASELAVMRAQSVVTALQLGNTEVVAGDIHRLDPPALGAPFDLAFTRLFLMHQADPVATLSAIARLVRPGGWVIVHEPLRNPPPRSHPHMDALDVYWGMLHGLLEQVGVPRGTVESLPRAARTAGLEVASADGFFILGEPELSFEIHASTLAASKEAAVQFGIAAKAVDDVLGSLRAGKAGGYEWVSTPFFLDLALRKP
jgi:ubiquinone/menaquinone biosynthesis C-methylase UbiE